jgi:hypothetical protein
MFKNTNIHAIGEESAEKLFSRLNEKKYSSCADGPISFVSDKKKIWHKS